MCQSADFADDDYTRLYRSALKVAEAESIGSHQAQDVAQEALIAFWLRTLSSGREPVGNPMEWIRATARYLAVRVRRRMWGETPFHDGLHAPYYETDDWLIDLVEALSRLPADDQALIKSRYYERRSLSWIANRIGRTERTVSLKLRRIESALARMLSPPVD